MNKTIQILSEICEKYRFQEKLLFVPSYSIGNQIGEHLAKTGTSWINLRTITAAGYAQELVALDLSRGGMRLIDSYERLVIIERLYRNDDALDGRSCYFEGASEIPGILKCLGNTIHEMRMAGLDHKSLDPDFFIVNEKGQELSLLLEFYARFLKENNLIDHAGLISMAIEKIKKGEKIQNKSEVFVLSDFPLTNIEKELICLVGGESMIVIEHTRPMGLDFPKRFFDFQKQIEYEVSKHKENIDLLQWLFQPEKAPDPLKDNTVTIFHALGESNEVREVFRRLFKEKTPLDDVEILVAKVDPYISLVYEIATSFDVPVTFIGGVPITFTRPGRALILYLKWQAEDFQASYLRRLFSGGYFDLDNFKLEGEKPSPGRAARFIRDAAIGWGRDHYSGRFKALQETFLCKAGEEQNDGEEEKVRWLKQTADKVAWVACLVEDIIATVPYTSPEEILTTEELCSGALDFVKKFCRVASEFDAVAKSMLVEKLESILRAPSLQSLAKESAERLIKIVSNIFIGHSNPKPGHVHVAHYRSGGYSGRSNTFVLGLDQIRFPGVMLQDPVILDLERRQLSPHMVLASQLLDENVYLIAKILSSLRRNVTLSYSCRDLREDREIFPSSLLLRVYRLITTDRNVDYRALTRYLGEPVGFIPKPDAVSLNDWEWWVAQKEVRYGSESVCGSYQHLLEGERAETARDEKVLSEYDGWIPSSTGSMDPLNKDVILSCSRLEGLAKCPFAYFVRYVLGVEPLEEIEKDASRWLDPLQRGDLLHKAFYRFMKDLKANGELPELKKHSAILEAITIEEVERWKEEVPPASELAYNREVEDIKLALEIFLKNEEKRCRSVEPYFFELSFGIGEESLSGISTRDPVEIELKPEESFKLRGRIDRVDRSGEHEYEVWDYKTGSTWGYKDEGYTNQGRHLQHALYSVATEILLRRKLDKKAKVVRAGYFFPSSKGEGRRIEKDQRTREELEEVLEDLFKLLRSGVFPTSYDKDPCGICPYDSLCGGKKVAVERTLKKLAEDEKMNPLQRLKKHA